MINQQQQPKSATDLSKVCSDCPLHKYLDVIEDSLRHALEGMTLSNGSVVQSYGATLSRSRLNDRNLFVLKLHEVRMDGKVVRRTRSTNDLICAASDYAQEYPERNKMVRGTVRQSCVEWDLWNDIIEVNGQRVAVTVEYIELEYIPAGNGKTEVKLGEVCKGLDPLDHDVTDLFARNGKKGDWRPLGHIWTERSCSFDGQWTEPNRYRISKIEGHISGTDENGQYWVETFVTDVGFLTASNTWKQIQSVAAAKRLVKAWAVQVAIKREL